RNAASSGRSAGGFHVPTVRATYVHLSEPKSANELEAGFIQFRNLNLDHPEELFLQITNHLREQEAGQAAAAHLRPNFNVEDPSHRHLARTCAAHLPNQSPRCGDLTEPVHQTEFDRLERAEHALLPPRFEFRLRQKLDVVGAA